MLTYKCLRLPRPGRQDGNQPGSTWCSEHTRGALIRPITTPCSCLSHAARPGENPRPLGAKKTGGRREMPAGVQNVPETPQTARSFPTVLRRPSAARLRPHQRPHGTETAGGRIMHPAGRLDETQDNANSRRGQDGHAVPQSLLRHLRHIPLARSLSD